MQRFELIAILPGVRAQAPDAALQTVTHAGHTAVLTKHPSPVIHLPQSRKQVLESAAKRQAWLEALMPFGTVLPVQPGHWITTAQVPPLIEANSAEFNRLHRRLEGQVQFQITVEWAADRVLDRFRNSAELAPLFASDQTTAPEVREAVQTLANSLAARFTQMTNEVVTEAIALPVTENVLWNHALLVAQSKSAALDWVVETIDDIWTEGFRIRQIGPAPASSFATLDLHAVSAQDISAALDSFGLNHLDQVAELRAARRRALMRQAGESDQSILEQIRFQADILERAQAVAQPLEGFHLCSVRADGQAAGDLLRSWAA